MAEGYTLLFMDASGFHLSPTISRTWAPVAQTPLLKAKLSRSKYNALAALTTNGRLFSSFSRHSFNTDAIIRFLQKLLRLLPGKLLILWDNAAPHHSHQMQDFLQQPDVHSRLQILFLPAYAPELNPVELVWRYLKRVLLKNRVCLNLQELKDTLERTILRLIRRPDLLKQFVRHIKLYTVAEPFLTSL